MGFQDWFFVGIGLAVYLVGAFVYHQIKDTKAMKFIDNLFFWLGIIVLIIILLGGVKFCSAVGSMY